MKPGHEIRIIATLERRDGDALTTVQTTEIRRAPNRMGVMLELQDFWQVTRTLATIRQCIPTIYFCSHDRSRCVAMRDPPFEPHELPERDRATTILEALRKLTHG